MLTDRLHVGFAQRCMIWQAAGEVAFTIVSPPVKGETAQRRSLVRLPIILDIIPTPPRYDPPDLLI